MKATIVVGALSAWAVAWQDPKCEHHEYGSCYLALSKDGPDSGAKPFCSQWLRRNGTSVAAIPTQFSNCDVQAASTACYCFVHKASHTTKASNTATPVHPASSLDTSSTVYSSRQISATDATKRFRSTAGSTDRWGPLDSTLQGNSTLQVTASTKRHLTTQLDQTTQKGNITHLIHSTQSTKISQSTQTVRVGQTQPNRRQTSWSTSTAYTTKTYTITSCSPQVTNCPGSGHVTLVTETILLYTTVCPVTETSSISSASTFPHPGHVSISNTIRTSLSSPDDQPTSKFAPSTLRLGRPTSYSAQALQSTQPSSTNASPSTQSMQTIQPSSANASLSTQANWRSTTYTTHSAQSTQSMQTTRPSSTNASSTQSNWRSTTYTTHIAQSTQSSQTTRPSSTNASSTQHYWHSTAYTTQIASSSQSMQTIQPSSTNASPSTQSNWRSTTYTTQITSSSQSMQTIRPSSTNSSSTERYWRSTVYTTQISPSTQPIQTIVSSTHISAPPGARLSTSFTAQIPQTSTISISSCTTCPVSDIDTNTHAAGHVTRPTALRVVPTGSDAVFSLQPSDPAIVIAAGRHIIASLKCLAVAAGVAVVFL